MLLCRPRSGSESISGHRAANRLGANEETGPDPVADGVDELRIAQTRRPQVPARSTGIARGAP